MPGEVTRVRPALGSVDVVLSPLRVVRRTMVLESEVSPLAGRAELPGSDLLPAGLSGLRSRLRSGLCSGPCSGSRVAPGWLTGLFSFAAAGFGAGVGSGAGLDGAGGGAGAGVDLGV